MNATQVKKIIKEKVDGVWVAAHDESGHHYRHRDSGVVVDSVTTKLSLLSKPHLIPWAVGKGLEYLVEKIDFFMEENEEQKERIIKTAKFAYTAIRDDAGNIGTIAHDCLEQYEKEWIKTGKKPKDARDFVPEGSDGRVYAAVRSGEAVFEKYNIVPLAPEILVGSEKYKSAGTLDLLAADSKGNLELWDHKTSNQIDPIGYSMQVATYKKFFEDMTGLKIKKTRIILLSKDYDKVTVYDVPNTSSAFKAFANLSKVYDWVNDGKEKAIKDIKKITL